MTRSFIRGIWGQEGLEGKRSVKRLSKVLITVDFDKFDTGYGSGTFYWRGSDTSFAQDAGAPAWNLYTAPFVSELRYFQLMAVV